MFLLPSLWLSFPSSLTDRIFAFLPLTCHQISLVILRLFTRLIPYPRTLLLLMGLHCSKNPPSSSSSHELMSTDLLSQPGLHPLLCNGESPSRASIELSAKPALPQDLSAAFCTTYFLIKSCPPPYFCDDKMRLEGPLTDHLVPLCCSKSSLATI